MPETVNPASWTDDYATWTNEQLAYALDKWMSSAMCAEVAKRLRRNEQNTLFNVCDEAVTVLRRVQEYEADARDLTEQYEAVCLAAKNAGLEGIKVVRGPVVTLLAEALQAVHKQTGW